MKSNQKYLFIATLLILALSLGFFTYVVSLRFPLGKEVLEVRSLPLTFIVDDKTGFDLNTSALTFGKLTPDSNSLRTIWINNTYEFPIRLEFYVTGEIEDAVVADPGEFMYPGERREFAVTVYSQDLPKGNYSGVFKIVISKAPSMF